MQTHCHGVSPLVPVQTEPLTLQGSAAQGSGEGGRGRTGVSRLWCKGPTRRGNAS
jgi:hypothetical protein